jgi:hypothetical protein
VQSSGCLWVRLLDLACKLVSESANNYPNGPLYWNEIANRFVRGLIARHTTDPKVWTRGTLGKQVLERGTAAAASRFGDVRSDQS